MNKDEHVYVPPRVSHDPIHIPDAIIEFLNGKDLLSKNQAICLSTINAKGYPHAALLSAGDVLFIPPNRIHFLMFPKSETVTNLQRDPRLVMTMSFGRGMFELRMNAHQYKEGSDEIPMAFFEAKIDEVRLHEAPYADIVSGVSFKLHDPTSVNNRWQKQISALKV